MRALERLQRLWNETTAPPVFGMPSAGRRLLRMRLGAAVVLALPALLLVLWYTWQGLLLHARTVTGTGVAEPLGLELFQLHLHDLLRRDFRRLLQAPQGSRAKLPIFALSLDNAALDQLDAAPPSDGEANYVTGKLVFRGREYDVRARYRGQKHWHWRYPQKSWKLRFEEPAHLLGHETLLLLNSPEAEPLFELALLELADERGLMVPRFAPARLLLNSTPMGLYFLEAPADEATLRHSRRYPWNLYSGNGAPADPRTGVSRLFDDARLWTKAAGPLGQEQELSELAELLRMLREAPPAVFARFAEEYLELGAFARFGALDIVFGIDQHNYDENQKLYFDPYQGHFEPVVWNLRGANHEPAIERASSPLTLRLAELPSYAQRRNRAVWELLHGDAEPAALARRLERWDALLGDAFEQDPLWDAVDLLPELNAYYAEMMRPMDRSRQLAVRRLFIHRMRVRHRYLVAELGARRWSLRLGPSSAATNPDVSAGSALLRVEVDGHQGLELSKLEVDFGPAGARPWRWRRFRPAPLGPEEWHEEPATPAAVKDLLAPGTRRVSRSPHFARGLVQLEPEARTYVYEIGSDAGPPAAVVLEGKNAMTGARVRERVVASGAPIGADTGRCAERFEPGAGGRSIHPQCLGEEPGSRIELGPGVVAVEGTREYGPGSEVTIAAGTTFQMAPGASMRFRGKVRALGRLEAPVRWLGSRWGVVALQGRGTAGSLLRQVEVVGATRARIGLTHYPAALCIHDTREVRVEQARVRPHPEGEDGVHLAYVSDARLADVTITGPASDALDLEHSSAQVERLVVVDAGDDAVDLMGSDLRLMTSDLLGCRGNGVSAGEQTLVTLSRVIVSGCPRALIAKNASSVRVDQVLVREAQTGVRVEQHSDWYDGESELVGAGLRMLSVGVPLELSGKPRVDLDTGVVPGAGEIASLLAPRGAAGDSNVSGYVERSRERARTGGGGT